jgi:hypothetical protein
MAIHALSANFASFFGRLNPSTTSEQRASSQYNSLKTLLEDHTSLKSQLDPVCMLHGSYRWQTATHMPGGTGNISRTKTDRGTSSRALARTATSSP